MCLLRLDTICGCSIDNCCVEKEVKPGKIQIGLILASANDVLNVVDTVATIHPAVQVCFHAFLNIFAIIHAFFIQDIVRAFRVREFYISLDGLATEHPSCISS